MDEQKLLERVTVEPNIFGGKPIIRGRRLAVEHVLGCSPPGIRRNCCCRATLGLKKKIFRRALSMLAAWSVMNGSSPLCQYR